MFSMPKGAKQKQAPPLQVFRARLSRRLRGTIGTVALPGYQWRFVWPPIRPHLQPAGTGAGVESRVERIGR
jgi:hypothetical protein